MISFLFYFYKFIILQILRLFIGSGCGSSLNYGVVSWFFCLKYNMGFYSISLLISISTICDNFCWMKFIVCICVFGYLHLLEYNSMFFS